MAVFDGKRLLVLGAGHFQLPVVECAKALGCYVITLDYIPENPAHRIAHEWVNESTVDLQGVLATAERLGIDGILTYGSDVSVPAVTYTAEKLGLPGNPYAAGRTLQRKDLFRALQRRLDIPHPRFAAADEAMMLERRVREEEVPFPLLVKPADSSGSKGQAVVRRPAELGSAFEQARGFARCGMVLAEALLQRDLPELVGDVLVQRGSLAFRHYGHNLLVTMQDRFVPVGETMPGFFGEEVASKLDRQLQAIVEAAGVRTGCLNFDGLVSNGEVYIVDIGLRNGGNYVPDLIKLSTGFDLTAAAVHCALGAEYPVARLWEPAAVPVLSYLVHAQVGGRFDGVMVAPELSDYVVQRRLFVEPGDSVPAFRQGNQSLGIVLLRLPDVATQKAVCDRIDELVSVRVR